MYVYYEHHKDGNGKIVLTELVLSSRSDGTLKIDFWSKAEKVVFEICKQTLKWPPIGNREYDAQSFLWSYVGQYGVSQTYGEAVIEKLETIVKTLGSPFKAIAVEELSAQALNKKIDLTGKRKKMSAEEFFYNHGAPASAPAISRDTIISKLKILLGTEIDKKAYRQAALRYHPDRNNGDGSKMSELNMLWQLYNQQQVT